jgi:hypothetical protein
MDEMANIVDEHVELARFLLNHFGQTRRRRTVKHIAGDDGRGRMCGLHGGGALGLNLGDDQGCTGICKRIGDAPPDPDATTRNENGFARKIERVHDGMYS